MTFNTQQITILAASHSHLALMQAASELFACFQTGAENNRGIEDLDDKLHVLTHRLESGGPLPKRLAAEWDCFMKALRNAYADFIRDVAHRLGVDEPAQVRNLALNIGSTAFTRIRERSREYLIQQVESIVHTRPVKV